MSFEEVAVAFDSHGDRLVGVLSQPASPLKTAVLIIVGGPQYRAGSHRQFVFLARSLAAAGYPTLRFDCRGMGDSSGEPRSFEAINADIASALAAFARAQPGVERFVLWGLCDGASAALLFVGQVRDPRIVGLCLANPWVRTEASLARTHVKHYYAGRLAQRGFWVKLLSGGVGATAIRDLADNLRRALRKDGGRKTNHRAESASAPFQLRMAEAWMHFEGRILLILSGKDLTAREFGDFIASAPAWNGALTRRGVVQLDLVDADHTLSNPADRARAEAATFEWLAAFDRVLPSAGDHVTIPDRT
jgi:exosortase A-associated hydrolase 1